MTSDERRMELFASQLNAVEGELAKRDLATVPTERLFDMMMKLGHELNATDVPFTFHSKPTEFLLEDMTPMAVWQA